MSRRRERSHAFASTAACHLLCVWPAFRRELALWRGRAAEIPDPQLRRLALTAFDKRGNIEGAALFATLAPAASRPAAVRALVAFQTAYNYLDALSEQPSEDPLANAEQLHRALLSAVSPGSAHADYYAHSPTREDGGYLLAMLDTCVGACVGLPSYGPLAPVVRAAADRILDFQTLNLKDAHGGHAALARWAAHATPRSSALTWWETAAAAGSSLSVHALIAAAASPGLDASDARELDRAYFPWVGALHSLLDSLVDREEDRADGRRCLLDYYHSPARAAARLAWLAAGAANAVRPLAQAGVHRVILTAMCSYYLSAPECGAGERRMVTDALRAELGPSLDAALLLFRGKRLLHALAGARYAR